MSVSGTLRLQFRLAVRNILARRLKSAVIGSVLFGNTLLLVLGLSLVGSMDRAMERNVTSTLAGHLQVYSASAPEKLELFGNSEGLPDIGVVPDFAPVKKALEAVSNIKAVVPMGTGRGNFSLGNPLDRCLADLRTAVQVGNAERVQALVMRARDLVAELTLDDAIEDVGELRTPEELARITADLGVAEAPRFWDSFALHPLDSLEFLEDRVAPLVGDPRSVGIAYVGTDLAKFADAFDRFEVVKGSNVPPGMRGLLLSDRVHERVLKNEVARGLDQLYEDVVRDHTLVSPQAFEGRARDVRDRRGALLRGLGTTDQAALERALRAALPDATGGLLELLDALLTLSMDNLTARRQLFYDVVAPHISLYDVNVGDTIVISSASRTGYTTSAEVRVFGTFRFAGLEGFDSAAYFNLTDLATYRALLAMPTTEASDELDAIQAEVRALKSKTDAFDDGLFEDDSLVEKKQAANNDTPKGPIFLQPIVRPATRADARIAPAELVQGPIGHAAVILRDPAFLPETRAEIRAINERYKLGLRVVDWNEAAGLVAQYFDLVRAQFAIAVGIIFLIALVIINTTIVIAVLERVKEIGTLRALGAQRRFATASILCETGLLGVGSCGAGVLAGVTVVGWLHEHGIPAVTWVWAFLFGGPRLYPDATPTQLAVAFVGALIVGMSAAFYPAMLATRVLPIVALRQGD